MAIPTELNALDLNDLVGTPLDQARLTIERAGGVVRAVAPKQPVTLEYRENRVTLIVVGGVVSEVIGIG
jgi:potato proteinase inhibitor type I family protein